MNNKIGFDVLFNNATIGIIVTDDKGRIILANPFLLNQFGYKEEEVLGQLIELLVPTRFQHRHVQHRDGFNKHPRNRPMGAGLELFGLRKDGSEFAVEVSLGNYNTEAGHFVIAFVSDISARKASEQALINLNAELELKVDERTRALSEMLEKEKGLNELKSRFVTMASHEFRTPLSTILSSIFLIAKYETTEEQPKRYKHIERIKSAVNMLTDILNDFLSVGKIEEGAIQVRFSEFDIQAHIENILSELVGLLRPGQEIEYKHTGHTILTLDPVLLKHITINLVSNAIKFSPSGKPILLTTSFVDGELVLSVKDQGLGISYEDQEHLFERFFRGENVSNIQGTGLGLHIVAKYTELMNGRIECISELEKGTEFRITFRPLV
ncbi:PAS domain-containing sensor histidine kinase [Chitinophaga silvisoli]|uniref:histidine kinase n=1 Tax=Chitinophaga silvisoli TaxID=2291814 RepID=A0A3E1NV59_9BACT|nr:PAS domain-containing sensor histidine kinase [Chitinophaga silvisoli]RFM31773.1 PAS domain-containing sensor histidine kinase [Chitinophaga silvisoli]